MFSDIYKIREVADGLCLEVEGKVSARPPRRREGGSVAAVTHGRWGVGVASLRRARREREKGKPTSARCLVLLWVVPVRAQVSQAGV